MKTQLVRVAELDKEKASGEYAKARELLAEKDEAFGLEELQKTFGASDLDETYYYRNGAEYARDAAQVEAMVAAAVEDWGRLDWACNNAVAGSSHFGPLHALSDEVGSNTLDACLTWDLYGKIGRASWTERV